MTNPIDALRAEMGVLLADGATGTNLFAMGLEAGEAPELWNDTAPEKITSLHRSFVEAGADIILTNSFGGTRHRLKLHRAETRVGLSTPRTLGGAVQRNRVRRRLRSLLRERIGRIGPGWDLLVIARPAAGGVSQAELGEAIDALLARSDIGR